MNLRAVHPSLIKYCQDNIIPQYQKLDLAHQPNHVFDVIKKSMEIAIDYDVDIDMIYVIAVFHDIGLLVDRKLHHIKGGDILKSDLFINRYFTKAAIDVMRMAIEDHRASNKNEPRSIYGKIISEADRLIDPKTIILRSIQFQLSQTSSKSFESIYPHVKAHLIDKYGKEGYLKLWLDTKENIKQLDILRTTIDNSDMLYLMTKRIYEEIKDQ